MKVETTELGILILEEAERLLMAGYREETNNNDGLWLEKLIQEFDELQPKGNKKYVNRRKNHIPYCAVTASVILDRAFKRFGITNFVRTASAKDFISVAKRNNVRANKIAKPGAVFLTQTSGEGSRSGYHAGIVWYVDEKRKVIGTIEGNTPGGYHIKNGCLERLPKGWDGIVHKERPISNVAYFIHVQDALPNMMYAEHKIAKPETGFSGLYDDTMCLMTADVDYSLDGESSDKNSVDYTWYIVGALVGLVGLSYVIKR